MMVDRGLRDTAIRVEVSIAICEESDAMQPRLAADSIRTFNDSELQLLVTIFAPRPRIVILPLCEISG